MDFYKSDAELQIKAESHPSFYQYECDLQLSKMTTGVTDFIKIDEIRQEIDSTYPNPRYDAEGALEVENNGYGHRLIGDAFEFLCKVLLYRRCSEVIIPWRRTFGDFQRRFPAGETPPVGVQKFDGWKWEDDHVGVSNREEWEEMMDDQPEWDRRSPVKWTEDEELTKLAEQYTETGMNTEGVVKAALVNAGWKPTDTVHSWINREAFEEDVLEEMEGLFRLLRENGWPDGETVFERPTFGGHRHILSGEGDFIVDDLLVDIKTTENRSFTNAFWRQLLMYYVLSDVQRVLHEVDGRTYGKEPFEGKYPEINRMGIYFARYGELQTVDMDEVIDDWGRYEEFRAWIVDRAIEENRHAQKDYSAIRGVLTEPYDYRRQRTLFDDY